MQQLKVKEQLEVILNETCHEPSAIGKRSSSTKTSRQKRTGKTNLSNSNSSRDTFSSIDDLSSISDYSYDSSSSADGDQDNSRENSLLDSYSMPINSSTKGDTDWKYLSAEYGHALTTEHSANTNNLRSHTSSAVHPSVLAEIEVNSSAY